MRIHSLPVLRMLALAGLAALAALAARARADDAPRADDHPRLLTVAVGETVERDVGFAIGFACDDTTILRAEMKPTSPESNTFAVTGIAEGKTLCRAGTMPHRPSIVFEVHVVAAKRPGK